MFSGFYGYDATLRGAFEEAELKEIRLVIFFDCGRFVTRQSGDGRQTNGAVAIVLEHEVEHIAVGGVEAKFVDFHEVESFLGRGFVDYAVAINVGIVSNALYEAVRDSRGEATASREKFGRFGGDFLP